MAVTSFKYAGISDLSNYFSQADSFDSKRQLFPTETSGSNHFFRDSGYVDSFFVNGSEQASPQADFDNVNGDGQWCYRSDNNDLKYQNSELTSTTINNQIFEAGQDFTDYLNQQLTNASMELNNLLDARYPTPLPKNTQISDFAAVSLTSEYDAVIVKATCYICASNLIRSKDPTSEEADYYYNLVTNAELTGITDRLNKGEWKLSFEVDDKDSQGSIRKLKQVGTMQLVETAGQYYGQPYDLLRITCTTGGVYGTAECTVNSYGGNRLLGSSTTNNIVTGGLDSWGGLGGLRVRFQGASMTASDAWEIEVASETRKISNASTGTIQLSRKSKVF